MKILNSVNTKFLIMRNHELLKELFFELTKVFNKKNNLEALAIDALNPKNIIDYSPKKFFSLSQPFIEVMKKKMLIRSARIFLRLDLNGLRQLLLRINYI